MTQGPRGTNVPTAHTSNELATLVRSCRLRLNPDDIPGLQINRSAPRRHRRRTASQEAIAGLVGYSTGWYSSLERGELKNYSADFLDRVAYTLRLSPDERRLLFWYATGHEPASPRPSANVSFPPAFKQLLDALPWPAYVTDQTWDVVAYNSTARDWFPWVDGHETNVMRWVFTYPEARRQLHQWETDWAPKMMGQLRAARARFPENQRLNETITEILDVNPDARKLWDQPLTYLHSDGDQRFLYLPQNSNLTLIQIIAMEPMRAPGSRMMVLIPAGESETR